jgi:hypothetical protein
VRRPTGRAVHVGLRFQQPDFAAGDAGLARQRVETLLARQAHRTGEIVDQPEAGVVAGLFVFRAGIAETDDETDGHDAKGRRTRYAKASIIPALRLRVQSARSHAGADEARAKALWPVIAQCQDWLGCLNCVSSNACFSSLHKRLTAYLLNC